MTSNNSRRKSNDAQFTDRESVDIDNNERTPLLNNTIQQDNPTVSTPNVDIVRVPSISRYRLTTILRIIFFIEFLTLLIIWFAGMKHLFFLFIFDS